MHASTSSQGEESIPQLLRTLLNEATVLLRDEVALAKQEVSETAQTAGRHAGLLAAGGFVAYGGALLVMFGMAALLYALLLELGVAPIVAGWLAPMVVGLAIVAIGWVVINKSLAGLRAVTLVPERTVETLQTNKAWIKEKVGT